MTGLPPRIATALPVTLRNALPSSWVSSFPHGCSGSAACTQTVSVSGRRSSAVTLSKSFARMNCAKSCSAFETAGLEDVLFLFVEEFRRGRIFTGRKRIVVKEYLQDLAAVFEKCGFVKEIRDYVLYR